MTDNPAPQELPERPATLATEERIDPSMVAAVGVLAGGAGHLLSGIADIKGSGTPPPASEPPAEAPDPGAAESE